MLFLHQVMIHTMLNSQLSVGNQDMACSAECISHQSIPLPPPPEYSDRSISNILIRSGWRSNALWVVGSGGSVDRGPHTLHPDAFHSSPRSIQSVVHHHSIVISASQALRCRMSRSVDETANVIGTGNGCYVLRVGSG